MSFIKYLLVISLFVNLCYLLAYIGIHYEFPIITGQNLRGGTQQTNQVVQNIVIGETTTIADDDDEIHKQWISKYEKLDKEWGDNYEKLRLKYNGLVEIVNIKTTEYGELRIKYNNTIEKDQRDYDELRTKYNNLVEQYNSIPKPKGYITTATGVKYGVY